MLSINSWKSSLKIENQPDEFEVKALLQSRAVDTPRGVLIEPGAFEDFLARTPDFVFPCVAKVCDPEIIHKTDRGGLELGLTETNWKERLKALSNRFPGSNLLMEEQLKYYGPEFIIGALVDPVFGPAVMFGAGGILTELYKDVTFRLAPLDKYEACRMLKELAISDVLQGYRGSRMDLEGLADIVSSIGDIVAELGDCFNQLDINPIVFDGSRWAALDAVLILC